jgi:hypothetical protein
MARKLGLQPGPTPELVAAQEKVALLQSDMMIQQIQSQEQQMQLGAMPGMLAPQIGGGAPTSGVGPEGGRPPTGAHPPQFVQKSGPNGPRAVVSESGT